MFKLLLIMGIIMGSSSVEASEAIAIPQDAKGHVGQNIPIQSTYKFNIVNNTAVYQDYMGVESLSVNDREEKREFKFSIPPYGSKSSNTDMISFDYTPPAVGVFMIRASIKIEGVNGAANNESSKLTVT